MTKCSLSGQGILEVIIGLGILLIGLFGTLALVLGGLKASHESTNRLVAINLAREAVEVVRNIRDSNWLKDGVAWDAGFSGGDTTAALVFDAAQNTFLVDFTANTLNDAQTKVLVDPAMPTFRRLLTVESPDANAKRVMVTVTWDEQGGKKMTTLEDWLMNWK